MSNVAGDSPWARLVQRLASRLRYPHIFLIMLALFVVDLVIPDVVPMVDEALLGLLTLLLGTLRKRRETSVPEVEVIDDAGSWER